MSKQVISTEEAPAAIGPYSQAIRAGNYLFISGQLGMDPRTGILVEGGIEAETRQSLQNLSQVLRAAGSGMAHVLKTTVFLRDLQDFARMNAIYAECFPQNPPARSAVQVTALPKGGAVEIEAIAEIAEG